MVAFTPKLRFRCSLSIKGKYVFNRFARQHLIARIAKNKQK